MDIIDYFALERMYRERRKMRQKVYVIATRGGIQLEGKIIKEDEGRWLVEFYPYDDGDIYHRGGRQYLNIRDFEIHPVDRQEFEQHIESLYDEYGQV